MHFLFLRSRFVRGIWVTVILWWMAHSLSTHARPSLWEVFLAPFVQVSALHRLVRSVNLLSLWSIAQVLCHATIPLLSLCVWCFLLCSGAGHDHGSFVWWRLLRWHRYWPRAEVPQGSGPRGLLQSAELHRCHQRPIRSAAAWGHWQTGMPLLCLTGRDSVPQCGICFRWK